MNKNREWVITANAAVCRIFQHDGKTKPLAEVKSVDWPRGRMAGRDMDSDRPGRAFDSAGQGRHAMEPRADPHAEELRFAREIATILEEAQRGGEFSRLIVIAAPRMLGSLRECLPESVSRLAVTEIDKDLTDYSTDELSAWLDKERSRND